MGQNIETGRIEQLHTPEQQQTFKSMFHDMVDKQLHGPQQADTRMRRHNEGPPIFHEDEVIELRGGRWRVHIVGQMLALEPLKG